jgi:hypothetical protein
MATNVREIVFAHEPDAAWIIALWKAIHGGDPSPEVVAAGVIAAVAPYLKSFSEGFTTKQLESGFETLGVKVTQPSEAELKESAQPQIARQYCFKFQGKTICITLPVVKLPPPH